MNSGKSLQLLATAHNFNEKKIPFIILKSTIDTRDGKDVIHSRALGDRDCISISPTDNIYTLVESTEKLVDPYGYDKLRWILVDECQFLTAQQVDELAAIADMMGVNVICFGLRTDFKTNLFPGSKRLFEVADSIEEIKSSCYCDSKTIFNARVDADGNVIVNGDQIEVGGDDRYVALCRKCYYIKTGNPYYTSEDIDEQ